MRKFIVPVLVLVVLFCASCQRWTKDVAFSEESTDAPEYSVEFDKNTSPTETK